jgi:hypothetical protein
VESKEQISYSGELWQGIYWHIQKKIKNKYGLAKSLYYDFPAHNLS